MIDFVQNTIDGVMVGSSYALLALGFSLMFGVIRRLNLSYGACIMIGCYAGTLAHVEADAGPLLVAAIVVLGAAAAGAYVERLCFAPMRADAALASMVSSFAIWMQLEQAAVLVLPRGTYPGPPLAVSETLALGPFLVRPEHLVMLVCAAALAAALLVLVERSRPGLALRTVVDNPVAARLVGVEVGAVILGAFALASAIGGFAGYLIAAADQQITPKLGMWIMFKGLIAMMLGGLGSLRGALAGGLGLGLVEAHAQWYLGPQLRDLSAYLLLFACLVLRPSGMSGRAAGQPVHGGGRP